MTLDQANTLLLHIQRTTGFRPVENGAPIWWTPTSDETELLRRIDMVRGYQVVFEGEPGHELLAVGDQLRARGVQL